MGAYVEEHQESLFDDPRPPQPTSSTVPNAVALLGLSRVRGLAYGGLRQLQDRVPQLGAAFEMPRDAIIEEFSRARVRGGADIAKEFAVNRSRFLALGETAYERLQNQGVHVLFTDDPLFPEGLRNVSNPPAWLFVQGDPSILSAASVAVVGTRKPSEMGIRAAGALASQLVEWGLVVVSGLAEGIDAAAHQVAVDYGAPTIAVLGTGISVVFPTSTAGLREKMVASGGAIVSEYLPDDSYSRQRFVLRNRIQAGLANAVCPVEAAAKSGTAHTLDFAIKLHKRVFGVYLGAHPRSNELLGVMQQSGTPVFDLAAERQRTELRQYLLATPGLAEHVGDVGSRQRIFDSLLREFARLSGEYEMSDADVADFITRLERMWRDRGADKR
jgi:DNA processing protein